MDNEYYYNNARSRYYNACSEINSLVNRINELKVQKQKKLNEINQLKVEIKDNQEAYDYLSHIITSSDTGLNTRINNIVDKTSQASDNYKKMVCSSDVQNKDLNDVYYDEITKTKNLLSGIFESLQTKKNTLNAKISDLKSKLQSAETELQDIEYMIRSTESSLQDWERTKSSAAIDMEYYSRKMNEAV